MSKLHNQETVTILNEMDELNLGLQKSIESLEDIVFIKDLKGVSLEAFNLATKHLGLENTISVEGIGSAIKKVWKSILEFFSKIFNFFRKNEKEIEKKAEEEIKVTNELVKSPDVKNKSLPELGVEVKIPEDMGKPLPPPVTKPAPIKTTIIKESEPPAPAVISEIEIKKVATFYVMTNDVYRKKVVSLISEELRKIENALKYYKGGKIKDEDAETVRTIIKSFKETTELTNARPDAGHEHSFGQDKLIEESVKKLSGKDPLKFISEILDLAKKSSSYVRQFERYETFIKKVNKTVNEDNGFWDEFDDAVGKRYSRNFSNYLNLIFVFISSCVKAFSGAPIVVKLGTKINKKISRDVVSIESIPPSLNW